MRAPLLVEDGTAVTASTTRSVMVFLGGIVAGVVITILVLVALGLVRLDRLAVLLHRLPYGVHPANESLSMVFAEDGITTLNVSVVDLPTVGGDTCSLNNSLCVCTCEIHCSTR